MVALKNDVVTTDYSKIPVVTVHRQIASTSKRFLWTLRKLSCVYTHNIHTDLCLYLFERQFECLGGNTKKKIDNGKSVTYKIKFIDNFRFMSSSL